MSLSPATARREVDTWAADRVPAWSAAERDAVVAALLRVSSAVTPRLVADVPVTAEQEQAIYWTRTLQRLEDWLASAARRCRSAFGPGPDAAAGTRIGLRGATQAEIEAIQGIGPELARAIARFVGERPYLASLEELLEIDGIGPRLLEQLQRDAYLDQPHLQSVSPSLRAFAESPSIGSLLHALERSDCSLLFGDEAALQRRLAAAPAASVGRFLSFLGTIAEQAERTASVVDGAIASEAQRRLQRHARLRALLEAAAPASGATLVNSEYVAAVTEVAAGAARTLHLMMFLATAAAGDAGSPGSIELIRALEAAAARGLTVRVILDQDDRGEPYLSRYINRPVLERLRAAGIAVRLDQPQTLLHSKLLVADGRVAVLGSHNWTYAGLNETHELSIRLDSGPLAAEFDARFLAMWAALPAV
ncbi:MAG: hypothetical protein EYC70_13505 [Planctomycetota bacterium]|nr:MAG: hypothetical protein EYC70_13505 [Planctomycetota bacterium]